jgi:hypothetical protein
MNEKLTYIYVIVYMENLSSALWLIRQIRWHNSFHRWQSVSVSTHTWVSEKH